MASCLLYKWQVENISGKLKNGIKFFVFCGKSMFFRQAAHTFLWKPRVEFVATNANQKFIAIRSKKSLTMKARSRWVVRLHVIFSTAWSSFLVYHPITTLWENSWNSFATILVNCFCFIFFRWEVRKGRVERWADVCWVWASKKQGAACYFSK